MCVYAYARSMATRHNPAQSANEKYDRRKVASEYLFNKSFSTQRYYLSTSLAYKAISLEVKSDFSHKMMHDVRVKNWRT